MPDYYDSWSANKRKKNPARPHTRASSDRLWLQQQHQQSNAVTSVTTTATTAASGSAISPRGLPIHTPTRARISFSPVLTCHTSDLPTTTSHTHTITFDDLPGIKQRPSSAWKFSKALFDSSPTKDDASYEADFDDVDQDDDDDEDDDGDDSEERQVKPLGFQSNNILPRIPIIDGFPQTSTTSSHQRRSIFRADYQPRLVQVREQHEHDNDIEQLDAREDIFLSSIVYSSSMARSSPSLPATPSQVDDLQSTSTFNTRISPHPILRGTHTKDQHTTPRAAWSKSEGRRPRPWSQVIWESPVLGDSSQHQPPQRHQQQQPHLPHTLDYLVTKSSRPQSAYPALTKDLFTPHTTAPPEKERSAVNKSVRINVDGDIINKITAGYGVDTESTARIPTYRTNSGGAAENLLPLATGKRELSNGRKHSNRLSLGSGFYAAIEPISLSAAMPSTPKRKSQLVKLPARPQSVLIPTNSHPFPGTGAQQSAIRHASALQPLSTETFKRRRHKSQQLEMEYGTSVVVPIPWHHLAPMGADENAKTFHGVGSLPAVPIPVLKKDIIQDTTLEEDPSTLTTSSDPTLNASLQQPQPQKQQPIQQQDILPRFSWFSRAYHIHTHTSKHQPLSQSQAQYQTNSHPLSTQAPLSTPSRFFPALLETSSSFFFKAPSTSLTSSPKANTPGSHDAPTPPPFMLNASSSANAPENTQHYHSYHIPSLYRKSLPLHTATKISASPPKSPRNMTTSSRSVMPFSSHNGNINHNGNGHHDQKHNATNGSNNHGYRNSVLFNPTRLSTWKRNSSVLFPFSLVSYESGGLLGEIKNTSTTVCTNAPSSVVAPGTPLPPGVIVSTGVPLHPSLSSNPSTTLVLSAAMTTQRAARRISATSSRESMHLFTRSQSSVSDGSQSISSTSTSTESKTAAEILVSAPCENCCKGLDGSGTVDDECDCGCHYYYSSSSDADSSEENELNKSSEATLRAMSAVEDELVASMDGSIVIQKSHVAVYEINPRWGPRLMMFLVTVGGMLCTVSGGFCAEHHCKDLQFCQNEYQGHGDWCGPSGVEGAPYMLTVGLSIFMFGIYAMIFLRTPISRLVGYSEIDQFL